MSTHTTEPTSGAPQPNSAQDQRPLHPAWTIVLWASAFVLAGLILVQAGRSGSSEARADLVSSVGGLTALTVAGASSEDLLLVIDGRSEELFVYRVENQQNVELQRRYSLPRMFSDARGQGPGRR
jgi:hypothetical protein